MKTDIIMRIERQYLSMTKKQRQIADYMKKILTQWLSLP